MFHSFEHQLIQTLKPLHLEGKKLLVAVSGGVDSMAGVTALLRVKKAIGFELAACYVHHGSVQVPLEIQTYRKEAQVVCEEYCRQLGIEFHLSSPAERPLKSENQLREFRYQTLRNLKQNFKFDWIVTVHHRDDVLETQMMRLLRGVGKEGLRAIRLRSKDLLRPFLSFSKTDLERYAQRMNVPFVQDPSNLNSEYLRNAVRAWLAEMEGRQPGVLQALTRSFANISERKLDPLPADLWISDGLSRSVYGNLAQEDRLRALVEYHKRHNFTFPRHTQFKEILRQLDMSKKDHIFVVGLYEWRINASRIWARGRK